jgi:hypothetical protein
VSPRIPWLLLLAVPAFACASGSTEQQTSPSPFANVITREELQELDVRNVYDAIERLRPRWLQVRSGMRSFTMETEIVVFQDGVFLGGPEVLQRMGIEGIYTVRYLDGPTAKATLPNLGTRHVQGAIVVSLRPPAPDSWNEEPSFGA